MITITQEDKDILNQYAQLKLDIKALEEKADELNPEVLAIMETNELGEIVVGEYGKLSLASRRTWKYPKPIKDLEDDLKMQKKEAEQTGAAESVEKSYVIFKGNKE